MARGIEGEELVYRTKWTTGTRAVTGIAQPVGAAAHLKARGNAALEAGAECPHNRDVSYSI